MNNVVARWSAVILFLILAVSFIVWLNSGYGRLSAVSYQYALALVSACNRHDETRVQRIAKEIDERKFPEYDRRVIQKIAETALGGNWELASLRARELLKAQVETSKY